jgi:sugar fermentation stimulation protein A
MDSGTYCLIIKLDQPRAIQIGKLGRGFFPGGYYVYVGSALNGLKKRVARHLSPHKKTHWHIDYLLEYAGIIGTRKVHSMEKRECALSEEVGNICQGIPMQGFGSSDCRCGSHLYLFSDNPLSNPLFERIWS